MEMDAAFLKNILDSSPTLKTDQALRNTNITCELLNSLGAGQQSFLSTLGELAGKGVNVAALIDLLKIKAPMLQGEATLIDGLKPNGDGETCETAEDSKLSREIDAMNSLIGILVKGDNKVVTENGVENTSLLNNVGTPEGCGGKDIIDIEIKEVPIGSEKKGSSIEKEDALNVTNEKTTKESQINTILKRIEIGEKNILNDGKPPLDSKSAIPTIAEDNIGENDDNIFSTPSGDAANEVTMKEKTSNRKQEGRPVHVKYQMTICFRLIMPMSEMLMME